jgi:hypothetical protein
MPLFFFDLTICIDIFIFLESLSQTTFHYHFMPYQQMTWEVSTPVQNKLTVCALVHSQPNNNKFAHNIL